MTWEDVLKYNNLSFVKDSPKLEELKETKKLSPPDSKNPLKPEEL